MMQVKERFDVKVQTERGSVAHAAHIADAYIVQPVLQPISAVGRQVNKAHKKVRRTMRQVVEVATIRAKKLYLKSNGHFDEVQKELKYEIYRQYLDHHVQVAKDKARHEFAVIESGKAQFFWTILLDLVTYPSLTIFYYSTNPVLLVRTNMEGMGRDVSSDQRSSLFQFRSSF